LPADAAPPVSPDEVVQVIGRTLADELAQPLTVLMGTLDLWEAGQYAGEPQAAIRERLQQVVEDLVRRFERLARARAYTPRVHLGFVLLDLDQPGPIAE
jgi:hypothetical protein